MEKKNLLIFFDILVKGLTAEKQVNSISYEDYEKWFLSSYTKDPSYVFQKEWRIVFTQEMGGKKQSFPFVKSIILGEKISEKNKHSLEIFREKTFLYMHGRLIIHVIHALFCLRMIF